MNQLPAVPNLSLTLAVPRDQVQRMLEAQIAKGFDLVKQKADSPQVMEQLKRRLWDWTVETCNHLKTAFESEAVSSFFSANVYFEPSLKFDDFERELDEFPLVVRGKVERLQGLHKVLLVIPEPPRGDYISAQTHQKIYHVCWRPFELAQYGQAIILAVKEIEDTILEFVAGNIQDTGVDLVRKAFDPETGLLYDKESSLLENQSLADLLAGFIGRYRGMPPNSVLEIQFTARVISLASNLMYMLETRRPKKVEQDAPPIEFEFLKD
ncbi:MAG: hypothetical protein K2X93_03600 [Candidatus Obscuribacterales bacterium]|nr:hypothetical protein [Candidatus Obscuribacterales bacterium]